jgi:DNA-binding NarL/FixJ family response regulator
MDGKNQIRVALADDHVLVRKGLVEILLGSGFDVVADEGNGDELCARLMHIRADVVLMDIDMPVCDGVKATRILCDRDPATRVIALSQHEDESHVIRMLRAGACAYLVKNVKPKELVRAIEEVHMRGVHFSDVVSHSLMNAINRQARGATVRVDFTDREIDFLRHCCTEMTYKEIGDAMHISPRTAERHSKLLCDRLGLRSRVGLVLYALKHQLVSV